MSSSPTPIGESTRLVLLRHAQAEHSGSSDAARPLSVPGRSQARRAGAALAAVGLAPDLVLASSAVRTRQTAQLALLAFPDAPAVDAIDELYTADPMDVLSIVSAHAAAARTVFVVGHAPTMGSTAAWLAGPNSDEAAAARVRTGLPTAGAAVLDLPGGWSLLLGDVDGVATLSRLILTPVDG